MKCLRPGWGLPAYLLAMMKILSTSTLLCLAFTGLFSPGNAVSSGLALQAAAARDTNIVLKDPRAFKCICYSGYRDGQGPGIGEPSEAQVREDLVLLKKYTHEIRTYGSGKGSHGNLVPKIADEIGLSVNLGVWVDATYDDATNLAAVNDAIALIKEGHKSIKSVIIGNEYMLRVRHPEITPTPNIKPDWAQSEARLVGWVKQVKAAIPKTVLVTTADTWSEIVADGDPLLSQLDYVIWHLHPWWENQAINVAVAYVDQRHKAVADRLVKIGSPRLVLGETGWPTQASHGGAVGSPENQTRFFKELTAWGWNNNFEFWSFTAFDESWKNAEGSVGGHWGFWTAGRQAQNVITTLSTWEPKYMMSENPDLSTTAIMPLMQKRPSLRDFAGRRSEWSGNIRDALGRGISASAIPGSKESRIFAPSHGSQGLLIVAP